MTEVEQVRKVLVGQLKNAKKLMEILDMIEERLLQMRKLVNRVSDEDLPDEEIQQINSQMKHLEIQVNLLNKKSTDLPSFYQ